MASQTVLQQSPQSQSSQSVRRIVTLDIETAPLHGANEPCPTYERAVRKHKRDPECTCALDAKYGRIACIGQLIEDGAKLTPEPICEVDERRMLERFWSGLRPNDLLVTHNGLGFDLIFVRQRCVILRQKPAFNVNLKKYYTDQVADIMQTWTNWAYKFEGAGLDDICEALGIEGDGLWDDEENHGTQVAAWWAAQDFGSIVKSCMNDVGRTYQAFCRMEYREPLGGVSVPVPAAPLATLLETPLRQSLPQRELVLVHAAAAEAAPSLLALTAAQAPAMAAAAPMPTTHPAQAPPAPRAPRRQKDSRRTEPREIVCRAAGDSLVLTGATFPIRDALKKVFCARGSKNGDCFQWEVGANHFAALAGLCQKSGIRLVQTA